AGAWRDRGNACASNLRVRPTGAGAVTRVGNPLANVTGASRTRDPCHEKLHARYTARVGSMSSHLEHGESRMNVRYCTVGGGSAAAGAIEGIRAHDPTGSILLLTRENHRPYRRPMLTKDLWYGTATIERLPIHPDEWYAQQKVDVRLRYEVI